MYMYMYMYYIFLFYCRTFFSSIVELYACHGPIREAAKKHGGQEEDYVFQPSAAIRVQQAVSDVGIECKE